MSRFAPGFSPFAGGLPQGQSPSPYGGGISSLRMGPMSQGSMVESRPMFSQPPSFGGGAQSQDFAQTMYSGGQDQMPMQGQMQDGNHDAEHQQLREAQMQQMQGQMPMQQISPVEQMPMQQMEQQRQLMQQMQQQRQMQMQDQMPPPIQAQQVMGTPQVPSDVADYRQAEADRYREMLERKENYQREDRGRVVDYVRPDRIVEDPRADIRRDLLTRRGLPQVQPTVSSERIMAGQRRPPVGGVAGLKSRFLNKQAYNRLGAR